MQQTIRRVTIAPISVLMVVAGLVVPGGGALALDPEPGEEKAINAG